MEVKYHNITTKYGTGIEILLTGDEVATAIDSYLVSNRIAVDGPRTITVNGGLCERGRVFVDPSGKVITKDTVYDGQSKKDFVENFEDYSIPQNALDFLEDQYPHLSFEIEGDCANMDGSYIIHDINHEYMVFQYFPNDRHNPSFEIYLVDTDTGIAMDDVYVSEENIQNAVANFDKMVNKIQSQCKGIQG